MPKTTEFSLKTTVTPASDEVLGNIGGVSSRITLANLLAGWIKGSGLVNRLARFTATGEIGASQAITEDSSGLVEFLKPTRNAWVQLTDAAPIALNAALGNNFYCLSAVDRTLGIPTNVGAGQMLIIGWKNTDSNPHTLTLTTSGAGSFRLGDFSAPGAVAAGKTLIITAKKHFVDDRLDVLGYSGGY